MNQVYCLPSISASSQKKNSLTQIIFCFTLSQRNGTKILQKLLLKEQEITDC